jgi:hypothetical protein
MSTPATLPEALVRAYDERFVNRRDTYALQRPDGRYTRARQPLDREALRDHLLGRHTLALYAPDLLGRSRWLCFDCDDASTGLEQLLRLQQDLGELGLPGLREASRRGGHLWLLCDGPQPAAVLRRIGRGFAVLLQARAAVSAKTAKLEIYPDVDAVIGEGVGHAVRASLGIHRLTGQVYPFLDARGHPCHDPGPEEALTWLGAQPRANRAQLLSALRTVEAQLEDALDAAIAEAAAAIMGIRAEERERANHLHLLPAPPVRSGGEEEEGDTNRGGTEWPDRRGSGIIAAANARLALPQLIARTRPEVGLRPSGAGWIGWCPFHDDEAPQANGRAGTPSLYIVENRRHGWSWRCLSSNCGAAAGPMHHAFDWLFWCAAGDMRHALAWARRLLADRESESERTLEREEVSGHEQ